MPAIMLRVDTMAGWQRVAEAVRRRREDLGMTQLDVAAAGGPSIDRIQAIESARTDRYSARTLGRLEAALRVVAGSIRALAEGRDDVLRAAPDPEPERPAAREAPPTTAELADIVNTLRQQVRAQQQQVTDQQQRIRDLEDRQRRLDDAANRQRDLG